MRTDMMQEKNKFIFLWRKTKFRSTTLSLWLSLICPRAFIHWHIHEYSLFKEQLLELLCFSVVRRPLDKRRLSIFDGWLECYTLYLDCLCLCRQLKWSYPPWCLEWRLLLSIFRPSLVLIRDLKPLVLDFFILLLRWFSIVFRAPRKYNNFQCFRPYCI